MEVSYDNTNLIHTERKLKIARSLSAPSRASLQRSDRRFCLDPAEEAMEIAPVLLVLSDHLNGTVESAKDILQASMDPFCSVYHGPFKNIALVH